MEIKEGDIFLTKLERDFFGAFRILKTNGKISFTGNLECILVAITTYINKEKPKLNDKELLEVLHETRFYCNNEPHINIMVKNGIENFELIGNIPLSKKEQNLNIKLGDRKNDCFPYIGGFESNFGYNAFLEWRWTNEKEEFQKEIDIQEEKSRIAREEYRKRSMKPKKMLEDSLFWEVINKINWSKEDDEERMQPAIDFLSKKKVSEIKQFQESLSYKLYQLDTKEHAKNIGEYSFIDKETHFSEDYFLYVRCCVVANGKDAFDEALKKPQKMPKEIDFEPLLYLAEEAYEKRMNKELEYESGCDYETYSNIKGWE